MFNDDEPNPIRPPDGQRFITAVRRIGEETGIFLRLSWAPEITSIKWGASHKTYCYKREKKHLAWWVGRMEDVNGTMLFKPTIRARKDAYREYEPNATHRLPNGQWLHPDLLPVEWAWPRWVIERRLQESERAAHERERYEWIDGVRVDALGPWPEEGKWALERVIAHHFILCCEQAEAEFLAGKRSTGLCFGQYRPPSDADMNQLRADIIAGERIGLTATPSFEQAVAYDTKQTLDQMSESERKQNEHYKEIIQNALAPALRMPKLQPFIDAIEKGANT